MKDYFVEEIGNTTTKDFFAEEIEQRKPMFSSIDEAQKANAQQMGTQARLEREAKHPIITALGKTAQDFPAFANEAINTAIPIYSAVDAVTGNKGSAFLPTQEQKADNPIAEGTAQGLGFTAPTGLPMRIIKGAEIIRNPLTRSIVQGAGTMATQIPNATRTPEEYASGIATGGAFGVAGRGVEKVAEGAIQQGAKALSGRIGDYLVKLPLKAFRFSKDPLDVLSKEADGLVSNNIGQYAENADALLTIRNGQLRTAVSKSDKTIDLQDMMQGHLSSARKSTTGSLIGKETKTNKLNELIDSLNERAIKSDFKNMKLSDAVDLKKQIADDFPFNKENTDDVIASSAHKIYHDINVAIEGAEPTISELNHRVSGLIDIRNAARNRMAAESRNTPIGLVGRMAGIGAAGIGIGAGAPVEGLISGLAIMGVEKAIQSPAVLTRVAKALSAMSGADRIKVMQVYPELNKVIKVDARDVEIITPSRPVGKAIPKREDVIDVMGKVIYPKLEGATKKLGYTPEYIQARGRDIPRSRRIGTEKVSSEVIPMSEKPTIVEAGGSSANRRLVDVQGEEIVPVRKTPIPLEKAKKSKHTGKIKGKTPIKRRSGLTGNKGEVSIGSGKPQDFATAEEYMASKSKNLEDFIKNRMPEISDVKKDGANFTLISRDGNSIIINIGGLRNVKNGFLTIGDIRANKRGTGLGSKALKAISDFADINFADIRANDSLNDSFWKKVGFYKKDTMEGVDFIRDPNLKNAKEIKSQLTSEWQAAQGKTPILSRKSKKEK